MEATDQPAPIWIRRQALQKRWSDMPNSTFYNRLKQGLIPAPEYPFGPHTPYWRVDAIQAHERRASPEVA